MFMTWSVYIARGGLVFKAYRLLYHSTLGLSVIKEKKYLFAVDGEDECARGRARNLEEPRPARRPLRPRRYHCRPCGREMCVQYKTNPTRPSWVPFREGLVFKAHRLLYRSTPGLRAIKKKKKKAL